MNFVSIIMGSKSDYEIMKNCSDTFEKFNVKYEMIISSAHRSPERTKDYVKEAEEKVLLYLLQLQEWLHI